MGDMMSQPQPRPPLPLLLHPWPMPALGSLESPESRMKTGAYKIPCESQEVTENTHMAHTLRSSKAPSHRHPAVHPPTIYSLGPTHLTSDCTSLYGASCPPALSRLPAPPLDAEEEAAACGAPADRRRRLRHLPLPKRDEGEHALHLGEGVGRGHADRDYTEHACRRGKGGGDVVRGGMEEAMRWPLLDHAAAGSRRGH